MEKSEEQWKEELTPEEYHALREKGTEPPFSGEYVHTKKDGVYMCRACGAELFSSDAKYDSGTGWPSFSDVYKQGNVELRPDTSLGQPSLESFGKASMERTEVICAQCGSHLGHVFDDLPAPRPDVYFVYAILCDNDAFYIGQTDNLQQRWQEHNKGKAAEYTQKHKPVSIAHYEEYGSREEVVQREKELKSGFGLKWLKREYRAGRTRQAGGPEPTGKRYCINSTCLDLKQK